MSDGTAVEAKKTEETQNSEIIPAAAPVAGMYQVVSQLMEKAFSDVKEEHLHARPNEHTNSLHWIFGHLIDARYEVARSLGASAEHSFGKIFSMGEEVTDPADYPSLVELQESFKKITTVLDERFKAITEAGYAAEAENAFPGQAKTVAGCVTFLSFHEAYHAGQIALIRKFFGYEQLVG